MVDTIETGFEAGNAQLAGAKAKAPTRPNRNSDARKEQNRIASRNYRAKRKQKLALLDQFLNHGEPETPAKSVSQPEGKTIDPEQQDELRAPAHAGLGRGVASAAAENAVPTHTPGSLDASYDGIPIPPSLQNDFSHMNSSLARAVTNHGWDPTLRFDPSDAHDLFSNPEMFDPGLQQPIEPSDGFAKDSWFIGDLQSIPKPTMPGPNLPLGDVMAPSMPARPEYGDSSAAATSGSDADMLSILEGLQNLSVTQKRELMSVLERQTATSSKTQTSGAVHAASQPFTASSSPTYPPNLTATYNWVSSGPRIGQPRVRIQREARRFADFIDRVSSGQLSPTQLSRVYAAEAGFYGAIFANCFALGMSQVEPMLEENGVSPFCIGTDTGYDPAMIGFVRRRFGGITSDLRPVDQQMIFGHHPYLDVLPFKTFREKALKALEHDPEAFDEEELCQDLSLGLVCWGAHGNSLGMDAGVPWDARSWEPKVWFLQKYWFLVGGWDEELWMSVRRWHALRGEKIRYDEGQ